MTDRSIAVCSSTSPHISLPISFTHAPPPTPPKNSHAQDKASLVLVGGCETFSDVPIRLTRPLRQALITLPKAMKKGPLGILKHLSKLKASGREKEDRAVGG
jgi:hypothetical protein